MKRTQLKRKTPLKRGQGIKPTAKTIQKMRDWRQRSRVALKPGKKAKEWDATRAALKPRFARAGITTCELRYEGCLRTFGLSFCHSKKRRNIKGAEIEEVALGCANCHPILELKPEKEMTAIVKTIRENNPI